MSTAVASFHARASLDVSDFVKGAAAMSSNLERQVARAAAQFDQLDNTAQAAFRKAATRMEQSNILDPSRGLSRKAIETARDRAAAEANAVATSGGAVRVDAPSRESQRLRADIEARYEAEARAAQQASRIVAEAAKERAATETAAERARQQASAENIRAAQERFRDAARNAALVARENEALRQQAEHIRGVIEPTYRLIEVRRMLAQQVTAGNLTMAQATQYYQQQHAFLNAMERGSKGASKYGLILQQAGYQAQDFAVQVASGTNAMVAFSQQASQMLGFFGTAGAVAGAVLATGILVKRMMDLKDASVENTNKFKFLKDAVKAYNEEVMRGMRSQGRGPTDLEQLQRERDRAVQARQAAEQASQLADSLRMTFSEDAESLNPFRRVPGVIAYFAAASDAESKAIDVANRRAEAIKAINDLLAEQKRLQDAAIESALRINRSRSEGQAYRETLGLNDFQKYRMAQENLQISVATGQGFTPEGVQFQETLKNGIADLEQGFRNRVDEIRAALDPMVEQVNLRDDLKDLMQVTDLTMQEAQDYFRKVSGYDRTVGSLFEQNRAKTGASALGGLVSDQASQTLQIEKAQLDAIKQLVTILGGWN